MDNTASIPWMKPLAEENSGDLYEALHFLYIEPLEKLGFTLTAIGSLRTQDDLEGTHIIYMWAKIDSYDPEEIEKIVTLPDDYQSPPRHHLENGHLSLYIPWSA